MMSFLSSNAGVIAFNNAGSFPFVIAYTAAARTGHFLSEQALAKAASIFRVTIRGKFLRRSRPYGAIVVLADSLEHLVRRSAERREPNTGL
jgi:hypothetical protein